VVFQFRDDPLTLGDFNERINKTANGLLSLGVKHGDKVALMLPNNPEFLYTWFALNKIGAVEVPINVALKGQGLAYQMVQSDCVALVADMQYLDRLEGVAEDLEDIRQVAYTDSSASGEAMPSWAGFEHLSFGELMDHSSDTPDANVHYSDLATILYTSGTTGVSKGVMFSHHYWYDIWAESVKYSRYTEDDILYTGLPFFHGNAQGITIGPAILADCKAVIVERFSASRLWDDCRRWNCTEANYIGGIIPILLKQEPREDDADNPIRLMVGAAAPNECEPGKLGEFIARSNKMFVGTDGYYNKPEATLELFKNGWIHTGDLGRMDEDGYFFFVDRKKQAIRRRGENISSFEVESVISAHEGVLESCVVGVPSDVGEEEVKAVVVLKEGHEVSEEELIRWCEPRMAYFAIPRYIAIRDSMPKTPSERVEKFKLKKEGITPDCWDREEAGIELQR
jgi:crotonobetaine/carnitine-CoA ligase